MATIRERSPGVFEVRVFVGRDESGRPIQTSRTLRGSRREAERLAASLSLKAPPKAGARTVADALEAWLEVNLPTWAPQTARDYLSRTKAVTEDTLGSIPLARLSVQDIELWHARLRRSGVGEGGVRNRHLVLRAALAQAETWSWLTFNPARLARLRKQRVQARGVMTPAEVSAALDAAYQIESRSGLGAASGSDRRTAEGRAGRSTSGRPPGAGARGRLGGNDRSPGNSAGPRHSRVARRRHQNRERPHGGA